MRTPSISSAMRLPSGVTVCESRTAKSATSKGLAPFEPALVVGWVSPVTGRRLTQRPQEIRAEGRREHAVQVVEVVVDVRAADHREAARAAAEVPRQVDQPHA